MKINKWFKLLLVILALVIAGVVFSCQAKPSDSDVTDEVTVYEETADDASEPEEETSSSAQLCVHVCGSVKKAGVYYLNDGSRVHEAISAAGGLSEEAASDHINLAAFISDGEQIYIPSTEDILSENIGPSLEYGIKDDGIININSASADELTTLPGIGKTKANAIVDYREKNGKFKDIKDITNVSGIGEGAFDKIKDHIRV